MTITANMPNREAIPGFLNQAASLLNTMGEKMLERIPLSRFNGEEDMKRLIALLATEAEGHVTGQNIAVDGDTMC